MINPEFRALAKEAGTFELVALRQAKPCDRCGLLSFFARKVHGEGWIRLDLAPAEAGEWVIVAWDVDDKPSIWVAAYDPDEAIEPRYVIHRCRARKASR